MFKYIPLHFVLFALLITTSNSISSPLQPYTTYKYSTELQSNVADLWWTPDEDRQQITFELHIQTTGWIALGISPAGGMKGADIALGWVDQSGQVHIQDRYAPGYSRPMIDNTTTDWFAMQGREQNGWTAIQFKRAYDSCDYMDVPIKSGTNILIFAYGLEDPDMSQSGGMIYYHDNRRGTRAIPLRSYGNPPPEEKFAGLDYFDFKINNFAVPATDTTYYCKIFKAPTQYRERRHAIAHKTMVDPNNFDLVHHLLVYECNPTVIFDDNNLPDGICDEIYQQLIECSSNIATGWAVGGDPIVEFPEIGGYPVGGNFEIKYYMLQMHYNNPNLAANRRDSSGIRYYVANQLRQHDLGYLTFGTSSDFSAIAIPPGADRFVIDSYCPAEATALIPEDGITVLLSFPHTHLQGRSLWTKIIRNQTAVDYLFNAEAYDFNFQFENQLPKPVQLFRGDEFATRCIYETKNKTVITLGGEKTTNEMCLHMFVYYPRMPNMYGCLTLNSEDAWRKILNITDPDFSYAKLRKMLKNLTWSPEKVVQWQKSFDEASRFVFSGVSGNMSLFNLPRLPEYTDLTPPPCKRGVPNMAVRKDSFMLLSTVVLSIITLLN